MLLLDSHLWQSAVKSKLNAMVVLKVWLVVPKPALATLLNTLWVFCIKEDADGNFHKYKARLCAQGSRQEAEEGLLTYAPTI